MMRRGALRGSEQRLKRSISKGLHTSRIQELENERATGAVQRVEATTERYELQCGERWRGTCARAAVYRSPPLRQARVGLEPGRRYRHWAQRRQDVETSFIKIT